MKHVLTRLALALAVQLALAGIEVHAQSQPAPVPEGGRWITQSGNLEIEIARCGMAYCGTVVRVLADRAMRGAEAPPPVPAMPAAPSPLGKQILFDLLPAEGGGFRGKIFNRGDSKIYDSLVVSDGPERLKLTISPGRRPAMAACGTGFPTVRRAGTMKTMLNKPLLMLAGCYLLCAGHGAMAATLPDYGPAPELRDLPSWINSPPLTVAALSGKVVLIEFWTYACVNCLRTLPYINKWHAQYQDQGLAVVGIHTPEFAFERDTGNVTKAVRRLGIAFPVAQDNRYATWTAYANQYWPATYLIDRKGRIRYKHFGEGQYQETDLAIRQLLAET